MSHMTKDKIRERHSHLKIFFTPLKHFSCLCEILYMGGICKTNALHTHMNKAVLLDRFWTTLIIMMQTLRA